MMKVKIFSSISEKDVEKQVNNFLSEHHIHAKDIVYKPIFQGHFVCYTVMVVYETT